MFDVSFSELTVIAVVALIVVGPEKLPKVARTAGTIVGRFQRYAAQIREEVNREARFEDLQKLQQEIKAGVEQGASAAREHVQNVNAPEKTTSSEAAQPKARRQTKPKVGATNATKKPTVKKSTPSATAAKPASKPRVTKPKSA